MARLAYPEQSPPGYRLPVGGEGRGPAPPRRGGGEEEEEGDEEKGEAPFRGGPPLASKPLLSGFERAENIRAQDDAAAAGGGGGGGGSFRAVELPHAEAGPQGRDAAATLLPSAAAPLEAPAMAAAPAAPVFTGFIRGGASVFQRPLFNKPLSSPGGAPAATAAPAAGAAPPAEAAPAPAAAGPPAQQQEEVDAQAEAEEEQAEEEEKEEEEEVAHEAAAAAVPVEEESAGENEEDILARAQRQLEKLRKNSGAA